MSPQLERLFTRTPGQRRWVVRGLVAALIVVPLAVAGVFTAALTSASDRVDTIHAIVVNNDEFVTLTLPDGTDQPVLAGRQLVTQLTAPNPGAAGFDWTISNSEDAQAALASGEAYAVLTIPPDFSASVTSLSGTTPTQADLDIRTDDAHSYLAGSVAQSVGGALTGAFGREVTSRYLTGLYDNLAVLGESLQSAADGAAQVSTGITGVATGLDSLADGANSAATGAASAATGASSFSSGVGTYTRGVDSLSTGLGTLSSGAAGLSQISGGWSGYTGGVTQTASGFEDLAAALLANPANAPYAGALADFQAGLDTLSSQGAALSGQTTSAISGVASGISQSASGAAALSNGSDGLRSGAANLASGVSGLSGGVADLATGADAAASGAHALESGAGDLASGLSEGAAGAAPFTTLDATATAEVVSEPVAVATDRDHPVSSVAPIMGALFVPVSLWIGALAIFLLLQPLTRRALASTASTGRIVRRGLGRAVAIAAAQAVLVTVLLHAALKVDWVLLPTTLSFALLLAVTFVAVHHALTVLFGRGGILVSLVLLVLQLASAGGLYPLELVAKPFQVISPFLPLTWAVDGMQAIVSGGSAASVASAAAVLSLFAIIGVLVSWWAVARQRGAMAWSHAAALA
ncbi:YhgE/Pip domain-containing protein [Cryobacterium psychrophilum]|uniref:YhgE/Pip domain-containing protein n=1 Tax=Cryobacterium psychrophilum TaxID=41988 RepID=A0A4Y8KPB7_9MICO|nr:YhgE/Pip family protein [Cryobacterium psychrophilum]TDW31132.1 putative membrane protein [Cryobacterium psychrophilum]TFD78572.1 YhgE/Pip domain-containing protein [Cryobacterium psychrophilum]